MILKQVTTDGSTFTVRHAEPADIPQLIELNNRCFPLMAEQNVVWRSSHLLAHQKAFREGQIVVESDGRILGAIATLIVNMGSDPYRPHTYSGITDGGYFHNHDPAGDTLYGADVYVDPDTRGMGIGGLLYEARRDLCRKLNLRRILAGGRLHGYAEHAATMSVEEYIHAVETGELRDLVLSFQLREGFIVRGVLRRYITDPRSQNSATLIEWINPDYTPVETGIRKVRVACVQYQVRRTNSFEEFADQVEYFTDTASDYRADFVLFPEFFSMQLLSMPDARGLSSLAGIEHLADLEGRFMDLMTRLAREYGVTIVAGSHPMRRGTKILNACPIVFPDGNVILQPKLHITPSEVKHWGITGGDDLRVIDTPKARIGVLICYDCEFPEAARHLADEGAEIIFVPYCTDDRPAYQRVRVCAHARAIENQVYVVTSGIIGNLPSVPAIDIHYGCAGIFSPSDFEFARDGVHAIADNNVEMLLVSDLDINDLYRTRAAGSVRPRLDRRQDLFEFRHRLANRKAADGGEPDQPIDVADLE